MLTKVVLGVAAVVLGFLGGVRVHQVVAAPDGPQPLDRAIDPSAHADEVVFDDCPRLPQAPPYPVNDRGLTYGSGAGIDEDDPGPDLLAAYGTNGRCGFIRSADRDQPARTLAEALEESEEAEGYDIPLYAQDGVTVIGRFHIGSGRHQTTGTGS